MPRLLELLAQSLVETQTKKLTFSANSFGLLAETWSKWGLGLHKLCIESVFKNAAILMLISKTVKSLNFTNSDKRLIKAQFSLCLLLINNTDCQCSR